MGVFSRKSPCPICGGKIGWLLPAKIEDDYICSTCYGKIDMDAGQANQLTMQEFKEYLTFYDQNQLLKDKFMMMGEIDFGVWDTKIIFDYVNKMFCMSKNLDKTIFEGHHVTSFTIKEDNVLLVEGSQTGICRYASTVAERAMAVAPLISQFTVNRQLARALDKMDSGKVNTTAGSQYFNVPAPFESFNVELRLNHPYWSVIKCNMAGPRFDRNFPSVDDYLRSYRKCIEEIEKLALALRTVAFPVVPEQSIAFGKTAEAFAAKTAPADGIEEIKKYKTLMEDGLISQQEFDAKKKQLLGI